MNILVTIISVAILVLLLAFAARLRSWIRSMRRDIYDIRDEVRAFKKANEAMDAKITTSITSNAAEAINASCINAIGFQFPVFLGGWSIDTFLGRLLIQYLLERRPKCIVELGSGSSTILIARILKILGEDGAVHIVVDHEAKYLGLTRDIALLNNVAEGIEFHHCPLVRYESVDKLWYDGIVERIGGRKIDLLIIDGPPGVLQPLSRYPAIPLLLPCMSDHCTIILDDALRAEEQEIARRWLQECPDFNLTFTQDGHGLAILTR